MTSLKVVLAAARAMLGSDTKPIGQHHGHNHTPLLRVRTSAYGDVIVKLHRNPQRHGQEVHAYRMWAPALGDAAPQLIAVNGDPPAIAITALPGTPLAHLNLTAAEERDAYTQAGRLLRQFHAAAPTRQRPGWCAYLASRGEQWLAKAGSRFSTTERRCIQQHLDELASLKVETLTPCHLDFMPRNLLRAKDGTLRIIDFEHARYDLSARDLVRLTTRIWNDRPDLKNAFHSTYGQQSDLDACVIKLCTAIDNASLAASTSP
ncbi:MAG TPA: aminoglycoside phosphotransferase family protein [Candidatus Limnocylindrales bacterium]|nr:aminoglycoside phosphotransferase family protein [Candidatus Limnocylindrales bacterium]